jgi:hypothetical protein
LWREDKELLEERVDWTTGLETWLILLDKRQDEAEWRSIVKGIEPIP